MRTQFENQAQLFLSLQSIHKSDNVNSDLDNWDPYMEKVTSIPRTGVQVVG